MQGNKTLFNTGNIVVVDDEGASYYFREALEKKYNIRVPKSKLYDDILEKQVEKYRKMYPKQKP